jgi:hypothetical protein
MKLFVLFALLIAYVAAQVSRGGALCIALLGCSRDSLKFNNNNEITIYL